MNTEKEKQIWEIRELLSENKIEDAIGKMSKLWTKGKSSNTIVNFKARLTSIQEGKLSGEIEPTDEKKMISSLRGDILTFLSSQEKKEKPAESFPKEKDRKLSKLHIFYGLLAILLVIGIGFCLFAPSKPDRNCEHAKAEAKRILDISCAKLPTADSNDSTRLQAIKLIMTEHVNSTPCESIHTILNDINESKKILERI